ncbi:SdrD B-like domain-containing protein [Lentzea sp. NPDC003310]|uniref:SdrD B-like domain-containing protein n=1 Tax=Lentzea sp. NPDC003310 TaxID=3154447 RepID=UPI0033AF3FE6
MKITVNLTNTTDRRIDGVVAECNRANVGHALGYSPDWYPLRGGGHAIEAGGQRSFTIEEKLPPGALTAGVVTLDCDFAPNAAWNRDGAAVHVEAAVTGGFSHTMLLGEDRNANGRVDQGEAPANLDVVLLEHPTGKWVAQRTVGADGRTEFTGLKAGDYQAVLVGPWAFVGDGLELVRVSETGATSERLLKSVSPAFLVPQMKLDKQRYESHETVRIDITLTNTGGQTAERVRVFARFWDVLTEPGAWGDAAEDGPGIRIPAGESRTVTATGRINSFSSGKISLTAGVEFVGEPDMGSFSAEADVVQTAGDITGVVYVDSNHNARQDPGEAAADTVVETSGGVPFTYFKTTTDAEGRFSFKDIPSGDYTVGYTLAGGWVVHLTAETASLRVLPGAPVQLVARGERPYDEALKATMVMDRSVYEIGASAKITITLTNNAGYAVNGVQAWCNAAAEDNELGSRPMADSWGDLRDTGVTLGPGETKSFVVSEEVPEGARVKNRVTARCYFAPWAELNYYHAATAYDWAAVVGGGSGSLRGPLFHDRDGDSQYDDGEGVPNTRVQLMTDREFGGLVTEAVSDARGHLVFDELPPGDLWAQVDGPWRFEELDGGRVAVVAGEDRGIFLQVVPGSVPAPPGGDTNDGGVEGGGALARTGASVLGLGLVAALLVAFGFGARAAGRRRTS